MSELIKEIMDQYEWKLRLWISICRPLLIGLILLYWSIYYYPPPPILLYLVWILTFTSTNPHVILLALFLYWIYPHWPPPKVTDSFDYKSHGLRTYPDASLVLCCFYLVLSAIQLHPHFYWYSTNLPAEKHLSRNYPLLHGQLHLASVPSRSTHTQVHHQWFSSLPSLPLFFQSSPSTTLLHLGREHVLPLWHKPRFRPTRCMPLFIMVALNTAMCYAVFVGKVPLKFHWYTHPIIQSDFYRRTSFSVNTVFNSEHLDPHIVDSDSNAFNVLFGNCANRTVSPVKSVSTI